MKAKNKYVAAALALFFGTFGLHKFYLGRTFHGVLYIFFMWISWLLAMVDAIRLLTMNDADFDIQYNLNQDSKMLHKEKVLLEREKIQLERLRIKAQRLAQEKKLNPKKKVTDITGEQADDLAAWHDLYEKGIIDKIEYEEKRKIILDIDE